MGINIVFEESLFTKIIIGPKYLNAESKTTKQLPHQQQEQNRSGVTTMTSQFFPVHKKYVNPLRRSRAIFSRHGAVRREEDVAAAAPETKTGPAAPPRSEKKPFLRDPFGDQVGYANETGRPFVRPKNFVKTCLKMKAPFTFGLLGPLFFPRTCLIGCRKASWRYFLRRFLEVALCACGNGGSATPARGSGHPSSRVR